MDHDPQGQMKHFRLIIFVWLLCVVGALAQPAPILRNPFSTNTAGQPVKGFNNVSITNASVAGTNWEFYGISPRTVARLGDISAAGGATNAVNTVESNGVVIATSTTNLNFVNSPSLTWLLTNSPSGKVHISATVVGGGSGGETNWLGDAGTTNATRIGLADGKSNNTNLVKTVMAGNGIVLTNNVGGTNVMFAIDPAIVASQTDLNSASNVLRGLVGETNWNGNAGTTNATRIGLADGKSNNTNLIKTVQAGNGLVLTNETGGTNVVFAIDPAVVVSQANLTASSNFLYSIAGETNYNGEVGTNATHMGWVFDKVNNTNRLRSLSVGPGLVLTNFGTNLMIQIDPLVVTTNVIVQTNGVTVNQGPVINFNDNGGNVLVRGAAIGGSSILFLLLPEVLSNLVATVAKNVTNVISLSTSNALSKPLTNLYSAGTLTLRGIQAGANITITANPTNYEISASGGGGSGSLAIQTNRVNLGTDTNLNLITGNAISIQATNISGTNDIQFNFTTFIDITSPPYNAKGDGTTDDTLAFQNAVTNVGAVIYVPFKTAGYLVTNIFVTNSVSLIGAGGLSKLTFGTNASGFMFNCLGAGTNLGAITMCNLELYGLHDATNYITATTIGTRSAIGMFSYGSGSKLQDLYIHGFDAIGVHLTSSNLSASSVFTLTSNNVEISHCDFRRNFNSIDINDNSAQYIFVEDSRIWESGFGVKIGSANCRVTSTLSALNKFGIYVYGSPNDGQGSAIGCTINSCTYNFVFDTVAAGFLASGNQIWGGIMWVTNSTGVQVQNNLGSITEFQLSTGGENWIRQNVWFTTFGNTVTHSFGGGTADKVRFSMNTDQGGNVVGDQAFLGGSNSVFIGNVSHTNVNGTNFIAGQLNANGVIVTNNFAIRNLNPQYGSYLVVTGAATGDAYWSTNRGYVRLPVYSYLAPTNAPAALDQGTNNTWRLLFDDTANESAFFQFTLPDDYYTNANIMLTYSTLAAAASKSNVWRVACMITKPNTATVNVDAYNGFVEVTNVVPATAGLIQNVMWSCNLTSAVAGDFIKLQLMRVGSNTFGKNTGDSAAHDIQVEYDKGPIK